MNVQIRHKLQFVFQLSLLSLNFQIRGLLDKLVFDFIPPRQFPDSAMIYGERIGWHLYL